MQSRSCKASRAVYQSLPKISPPCGVTAAHHVVPLMALLMNLTLPSPMPTFMPPVCDETDKSEQILTPLLPFVPVMVTALFASQKAIVGFERNLELGPM